MHIEKKPIPGPMKHGNIRAYRDIEAVLAAMQYGEASVSYKVHNGEIKGVMTRGKATRRYGSNAEAGKDILMHLNECANTKMDGSIALTVEIKNGEVRMITWESEKKYIYD